MKTVTHPFGTVRRAVIVRVARGCIPRRGCGIYHMAKDELNEGHFLFGGAMDPTAKFGNQGTLTFTEGGPTGGYWKFKKD